MAPTHEARHRSRTTAGAPLAGRTVVVTRARDQAADLVDRLEHLGAEVVVAPVIEIIEPSDAGAALQAAVSSLQDAVLSPQDAVLSPQDAVLSPQDAVLSPQDAVLSPQDAVSSPGHGDGSGAPPDWLVFTSANAVRRFCARLGGGTDLGVVRVAAIGSATATAAEAAGLNVDLMPDRFVAEDLLEVFPDAPPSGGRVLLPRAEVARDVLPEGLRRKGWAVEVVPAYRTVPAVVDESTRDAVLRSDVVCFASSSAVGAFVDVYGSGVPAIVAVIGPVTAERARNLGLNVSVQPEEHTVAAMVEAIARHFEV